jgi:putative ABC transport system ATP-binding protein
MALLHASNLRKTYRISRHNEVEALRGVTLNVEPGEIVGIMGPSGSGKSTLLHLLGLLHGPDRIGGPAPELSFDGHDVVSLSDRARTRLRATDMGFVFQSYNLVQSLTALENVMLAGQYAGVPRAKARADSLEALGWVGLAERQHPRPMEMSGGEQQRVAIARALVNRPKLLLGDEPTGNLDSKRSAEVLQLLRTFNREHGQTVLMVTHDPNVGATCDRVVHMRDGRCERSVVNPPQPSV